MIEIELLLDDATREKVVRALNTEGWLADIRGSDKKSGISVRVVIRPARKQEINVEQKKITIRL